jgi:hypothetical protein
MRGGGDMYDFFVDMDYNPIQVWFDLTQQGMNEDEREVNEDERELFFAWFRSRISVLLIDV